MSLFPLQKLINRAYNLFLGHWAEQGEPLVSTFSRELVDTNNNTVMTAQQASELVAGNAIRLFNIPANADTVTVTGLDLADDPTGVVATVMRLSTDGVNISVESIDYDSLSTDGFICNLSGLTPTANYKLAFLIS